MSELQQDSLYHTEGRTGKLKDDKEAGLKVTASLRDQQIDKLWNILDEKNYGQKIINTWMRANSDRTEWLERQATFLQELDQFIDPIYDPALEWSSTLHLPTSLSICKAYHGRMYAALMSVDPPFVVKARKSANVDRAVMIEGLMRYALFDWMNQNEGCEDAVDRWLWDWVTKGYGILKGRWHREFTRFADIDTQQIDEVDLQTDPVSGRQVPVKRVRQVEKEVTRTIETFCGPMLEHVALEDFVIVGGEGDAQKADYVMHSTRYTATELYSLADQKIFRPEIVDAIIASGKSYPVSTDQTGFIKQQQIENAGMAMLNKEHELDRYRVIEAYLKVDVDGSGIASDIIAWVHEGTKKILRATYLRRVEPTGMRPFFPIHFHLRQGTEYPVGLVELTYSLCKAIDAMHNIKVDVGLISSMPVGFYRPTASSLKEERMPIEPGALIPVDNPQTDVFFPNLGSRTAFGMQEEAALMEQINRLTSISDLNYGLMQGQGATRTATGTRALLGESSNNLNIFIQRMNRGWKRALKYTFALLQYRLPAGFSYRILGDNGDDYFKEIPDRMEIAGMYDFQLESNSVNSNKQIQIEQANMIMQTTSNPMDLQLGLVTPLERYEAIAYMYKVNGITDVSRFVRKPDKIVHVFTPLELANRILSGVDVNLDPTQDLKGFIAFVQHVLEDDQLNGQFDVYHLGILMRKAKEAQNLLGAMEAAQAQNSANMQQQLNTQAAMVPQNMQPTAVNQQPAAGEGG